MSAIAQTKKSNHVSMRVCVDTIGVITQDRTANRPRHWMNVGTGDTCFFLSCCCSEVLLLVALVVGLRLKITCNTSSQARVCPIRTARNVRAAAIVGHNSERVVMDHDSPNTR